MPSASLRDNVCRKFCCYSSQRLKMHIVTHSQLHLCYVKNLTYFQPAERNSLDTAPSANRGTKSSYFRPFAAFCRGLKTSWLWQIEVVCFNLPISRIGASS